MEQKKLPFIQTQKQKQLLMKVIMMIHFNQCIVQLYQRYTNLLEQVQVNY